ncbi:uncharacterized protein A1O9_06421 [Exophiala aquamarina CBS 119918]|uniref:Chromate transporter n=1 Tax=Exophiala aquamarina CBS 119918 TaxID=1182545 RepID=A0A072PSJ2_9EURO|nr:uncharacterized protein A1O9_06421 [Exophiala aquamarina CBS 119918]KEF58495.1 hypothetical protein A1O9_06421 [Exophiala aquamarina CBS 119918]
MPLIETLRTIHEYTRDRQNDYHANNTKLVVRLADVVSRTWDLGFTALGGPLVHFGILHQRFVDRQGGRTPWIDEQTACLPLLGPASTKMLFCMTMIHAGWIPAILVFLLWSLRGVIGMYGLSLGVQKISNLLPGVVYALLSGLNAATVGLVAPAAVELAEKAIKDRLSRILGMLGDCAGMCYNAVWYFPGLIVLGGIVAASWDVHLRQQVLQLRRRIQRHRVPSTEAAGIPTIRIFLYNRQVAITSMIETSQSEASIHEGPFAADGSPSASTDMRSHGIPVWGGMAIIAAFFVSLIIVIVTRAMLDTPPLEYNLFANMYLAGTIIFGGGPVVIPLLHEYVVQPGWVSSRDFLVGLAIIQASPGPNFNFSVYLGALVVLRTNQPTITGAFISYIGIFFPGLKLAVGAQGIWRVLRTRPLVVSLLRGINATAVGLVFTAVYRL